MNLSGPSHRIEIAEKHGDATIDEVHVHFHCGGCGKTVPDTAIRVVPDTSAGDPDEVFERSALLLRDSLKEKAACVCGARARATAADYHARTGGRDLVLRLRAAQGTFARLLRAPARELLWWTGDAFVPAEPSAAEWARFSRDLKLRALSTILEVHGARAAVAALEHSADEIADEPALMRFVPIAVECGAPELAGAIALAQLDARPDDPDAHFWRAEVIIRMVGRGAWKPVALETAAEHLHRALRIDPRRIDASIALASIHRARGERGAAAALLEELVEREPENALVHYNLGITYLADDPLRALTHFNAGELGVGDDADYPMGCARALVALKRLDEARAALARASALRPDHPRVAEIERALAVS